VQELGGSTARQPAKLASGDIPYRGRHAQFRNGLDGGQEFELFCEFDKFCDAREFSKICDIYELQESCGFRDRCSGTGYAMGGEGKRKIVLCIACFAYLLLLVVVVELVFPLLLY